jgi:hypothetical protein
MPPPHPLEAKVAEHAACTGIDAFTSVEASYPRNSAAKKLKEICHTCPVMKECREVSDHIEAIFGCHVSTSNFLLGVWGGETPVERVRRRRAAQRETAPQAA